jgi:regulatory protein
MPVITQIKPQKRKARVNVYLDGKFSFGIDLDNFVKLGLKIGRELTDSEVVKIVKKAEFQKTLDKLLRFATLRSRSKKEVDDWLRRKKVHKSICKSLFDRLKHFNLIDDEAFATWWVGQRMRFKPKPKKILKQELLLKGIDKEIIRKVLEETRVDEVKVARKLLQKNVYKWERYKKAVKRQKAGQYLLRKGFSWDNVKKALDAVLAKS